MQPSRRGLSIQRRSSLGVPPLLFCRSCHSSSRGHHVFAIAHRHPYRLPAAFAHDRRQIHIQRQQVLCRPDAHGVPADALDILGREFQVPRHRLERPGDGLGTQSTPDPAFPLFVVSHCLATNNTPKDRAFFGSSRLQPGFEVTASPCIRGRKSRIDSLLFSIPLILLDGFYGIIGTI